MDHQNLPFSQNTIIKNKKKVEKQKSYVQLKLAGFCYMTKCLHPVTMEPEVLGG